MSTTIQLTLWPDDHYRINLTCPSCSRPFNALPALRQHQRAHQREILDHPRVKALRDRTVAFLAMAMPVLEAGQPVGVTQLAAETAYSPAGAYHHIRHLVDRGVLAAEVKSKGGQYHHYRLTLPNGRT